MKALTQYINEWKVSGSTVSSINKIQIVNGYDELSKIVKQRYDQNPEILDFSDLNVSNITNFNKKNIYTNGYYGLFSNLEHTRIINVTGWDTKQVTDMSNLFWGCIDLEEVIGLKTWDFSSVEVTRWMFFNCWKLEKVDGIEHLKSFNPNNILTHDMFAGCRKLEKPKWYKGAK